MTAKTSFANGVNPFTGQRVAPSPMSTPPKKADKPSNKPVELDQLVICDGPIPEHRAKTGGKYDALLSKLKPGQCIKCPRDDVDRIANAIKKHVDQKHPTCMVRSMRDYGDGMGRVWMLPRPQKA